MNNLQLLLSSKLCTIKDLQAEIVLIICHSLITNYLEKEQNESIKSDSVITKEEYQEIHSIIEELFAYLTQNVVIYPKIIQIINNPNKTKHDIVKARLIEPYYYFYRIVENAFFSRLDFVTNQSSEKEYIPDFLALNLIVHFKERAGENCFKKFEYIHNLDFSNILKIYSKIHAYQKEKFNTKINTPIQEQTVIRKMRHISNYMIDKLIEAKYIAKSKKTNSR